MTTGHLPLAYLRSWDRTARASRPLALLAARCASSWSPFRGWPVVSRSPWNTIVGVIRVSATMGASRRAVAGPRSASRRRRRRGRGRRREQARNVHLPQHITGYPLFDSLGVRGELVADRRADEVGAVRVETSLYQQVDLPQIHKSQVDRDLLSRSFRHVFAI